MNPENKAPMAGGKEKNAEKGRAGEEQAVSFLVSRGYEILERNYRTGRGEIDIIAHHKGMLVFIEVKSRRNSFFGAPAEAVDYRKQRSIRNTARHYMLKKAMTEALCRFDVVSIVLETGSVEVVEDAF
jgi:putative endonuclease